MQCTTRLGHVHPNSPQLDGLKCWLNFERRGAGVSPGGAAGRCGGAAGAVGAVVSDCGVGAGLAPAFSLAALGRAAPCVDRFLAGR